AHAARALGDEKAPVGEELQPPGVLEPPGKAFNLDLAGLCRRRGVGDDRGGGCGEDGERPRQGHSDPANSMEHRDRASVRLSFKALAPYMGSCPPPPPFPSAR